MEPSQFQDLCAVRVGWALKSLHSSSTLCSLPALPNPAPAPFHRPGPEKGRNLLKVIHQPGGSLSLSFPPIFLSYLKYYFIIFFPMDSVIFLEKEIQKILTKNYVTNWNNVKVLPTIPLFARCIPRRHENTYSQKQVHEGSCPCGTVVMNPPSNARNVGSVPGQESKIPHASEQLTRPKHHNNLACALWSPHTTTREAMRPQRKVPQIRPDTAK